MEDPKLAQPMSDDEINRQWDSVFGGGAEGEGSPSPEQPLPSPDGAGNGGSGDGVVSRDGGEAARTEGATAPEGGVDERIAKLEAENHRLKSEAGRVKPLAERNRRLLSEIEKLRTQVAGNPAGDGADGGRNPSIEDFSTEERAYLGDEPAAAIQARFGNVSSLIEEQRKKLELQGKRLKELTDREDDARREAMNDTVESVFGKSVWELQEDQRFKDWLEEENPLAGRKNGLLLNDFTESVNERGLLSLLEAYVRKTGWKDGKYPEAGQSSGSRKMGGGGNVGVMPSVSRAATMPSDVPSHGSGKRVYSQAEAEALYRKADMNPSWAMSKEGMRVFNDLSDAMYEGRIR